jgi:hypothetical protein
MSINRNFIYIYIYFFVLAAVSITSLFWAFDISVSWESVLSLVVSGVAAWFILGKLLPPVLDVYLKKRMEKHRAVWDERLKECGGDMAVLERRYHIKLRSMIYLVSMLPIMVIMVLGSAWLGMQIFDLLNGGLVR